jgi:TetR/AcrR family transcriptional regulator, regulator of autoinduction and epiphytic fitness
VKSVYTLAEKPQLLLLAVDRAIVGDDEPVPFAERGERRRIVEATAQDRIRLTAELGARSLLRLFPIYRAFEQAAATDPVVHERWREYQQRRRDDVQALVTESEPVTGLSMRCGPCSPGIPWLCWSRNGATARPS